MWEACRYLEQRVRNKWIEMEQERTENGRKNPQQRRKERKSEQIDFSTFVDVLLTVQHISIILVTDQLNPYRTNVENRVSS